MHAPVFACWFTHHPHPSGLFWHGKHAAWSEHAAKAQAERAATEIQTIIYCTCPCNNKIVCPLILKYLISVSMATGASHLLTEKRISSGAIPHVPVDKTTKQDHRHDCYYAG